MLALEGHQKLSFPGGGDLMSKDSALIATFIGILFVISAIATEFYMTHPAAAAIVAQMPPA